MDKKVNKAIYIGVMSGTSFDGIDIVAVSFDENKENSLIEIFGHKTYSFTNQILKKIKILAKNPELGFKTMLETDMELGREFALNINAFLYDNDLDSAQIKAIGMHGQTILHNPNGKNPFSCQIGNAHMVAELTNITTINDFRNRDVVAGGQGAPLICGFHNWIYEKLNKELNFLNIGGIANITLLNNNKIGYDISPGNCLIDAFCNKNTGALFDKNGDWAKSGKVDKILLKKLLQDPYFSKKHPKSTGVEYFNLKWLEKYTQDFGTPKDIQATLVELNAMVLKDTLNMHNCNYKENTLYAFGGGVHNTYMIGRMQEVLECKIKTSNDLGINPDFMEAIGFAWLANQTTSKNCSSLPEITGAKKEKILGSVHLA